MPNASKRTIHDVCFENDQNEEELNQQLTPPSSEPLAKKTKKSLNVRFNSVNVFYFERQQGYQAIPSAGSNTVGMSFKHSHKETYTLEDYLSHKRVLHLNVLENDLQMKKVLINNLKFKNNPEMVCDDDDNDDSSDCENYDLTTDAALLDVSMELPINSELFCPLLTPAERTRIIKLNSNEGVDDTESKDINQIRKSREKCGCSCKDVCNEDTCQCILNGIGCQLDKTRFPCACSMKKCKNPFGVKRFDVKSVRNHYNKILYPHFYEPEIMKENIEEKVKTKSKNKPGRKRKSRSESNGNNRKRKRSKSPISDKIVIVIDSHGSSDSSSISSNDNENLIKPKSINNCLDVLPYEPFDLFESIFKTSNNIQEITI